MFYLCSDLIFKTTQSEEEILKTLNSLLCTTFIFHEEDEDGDRTWKAKAFGFICTFINHTKPLEPKYKDRYRLMLRPYANLYDIIGFKDIEINFHFKALLAQANFEHVFTREELNNYMKSQ